MSAKVAFEVEQDGQDWGEIVIALNREAAPETVDNFLQYVEDDFFAGTIFHRVIPTFMIQGGGYTEPGKEKSGQRSPIKNEAADGLKNERGTIAMARTSEPHSATSQFFINVRDNQMLDHPGHDGWGYCAFGKVVDGMDVVDRIKDVPTTHDPLSGEDSKPVNPPRIKACRRVEG